MILPLCGETVGRSKKFWKDENMVLIMASKHDLTFADEDHKDKKEKIVSK